MTCNFKRSGLRLVCSFVRMHISVQRLDPRVLLNGHYSTRLQSQRRELPNNFDFKYMFIWFNVQIGKPLVNCKYSSRPFPKKKQKGRNLILRPISTVWKPTKSLSYLPSAEQYFSFFKMMSKVIFFAIGEYSSFFIKQRELHDAAMREPS